MSPTTLLDDLVKSYGAASVDVLFEISPLVLSLAATLFVLQITWDLSMWALVDADGIFGKAMRKGTIFLILYGLLSTLPAWLPAILRGFEVLGQRVTGLSGLSPSGILSQGIDLAFTFFNSWEKVLSAFLPNVAFVRGLALVFVVFAFGLVAVALARVLIEAALALGGLVIFLGFSGHRLTLGLAEGYLRYLLDLGVRTYVLFLIVAVGKDLGREWDQALRGLGSVDLHLHFSILVASLLFALLAWSLPKEIASRITASFSLGDLWGDRP